MVERMDDVIEVALHANIITSSSEEHEAVTIGHVEQRRRKKV